MKKRTENYRTKDGRKDYKFSFEEQSNKEWRAYIEKQPSYDGRPSDVHSSHRYRKDNRYYVCWTKPFESLDEAKTIAAKWAEATQKYIKTGTRF